MQCCWLEKLMAPKVNHYMLMYLLYLLLCGSLRSRHGGFNGSLPIRLNI